MSYVYLTISECVKIEALAELNYPIREIACKLGCIPSTVSRGIERCEREGSYQAELAQEIYTDKKKNWGAKSEGTEETEETVATIQRKLDKTWSS